VSEHQVAVEILRLVVLPATWGCITHWARTCHVGMLSHVLKQRMPPHGRLRAEGALVCFRVWLCLHLDFLLLQLSLGRSLFKLLAFFATFPVLFELAHVKQ